MNTKAQELLMMFIKDRYKGSGKPTKLNKTKDYKMTRSQKIDLIKKTAEELECMIEIANRAQDSENCYNYNTCYELLKMVNDI